MKTKYKTTNELPFSLCADDVAGALGISRVSPDLKSEAGTSYPKTSFLNGSTRAAWETARNG